MRTEDRLKVEARRLGFTLSGIAPAADADGFGRFADWLSRGYHGEMAYLERLRDEHRHPRSVFADVRSVLMVGYEYAGRAAGESPPVPASQFAAGVQPLAKVAAYARGPDYHRVVWDKLNALAAWLEGEVPGSSAFGVADTAPLLERDFARRAGLGWVGKNAMLINKHRGSFFFLGALLTDLDLAPDEPHAASHCGTCTACLDACPTAAFPEPGVLDARRCISYLTVELRSPMPEELRPAVGDWLYGCDVCQDVCPWNRASAAEVGWLDPAEILGLTEAEFRRRFRGTVFFRAKRSGLARNAAVVLGNAGDRRALPALGRALADPDETVREAAAWAIRQIETQKTRAAPPRVPLV